jgi:hypothetical protein
VYSGAANPLSRKKRTELSHRQGHLRRFISKGEGFPTHVLHQVMPSRISQLVMDLGIQEVRIGIPRTSAFKRDNLKAAGRKLFCNDAASPPETNDQNVDGAEFGRHFNVSVFR